jgi:class 3 adenylate cyclase
VHHIIYADLCIPDAAPDGSAWPDEVYDRTLALARELQGILVAHGGIHGKIVGALIFSCLRNSEALIPALTACRRHFQQSATAKELSTGLRALIHYGEVVVADGDAFGDNVGLAASMLTECRAPGIFLSAPARSTLTDAAALRLAPFRFDRFTRNPRVANLARSPDVYELV